MKNISAFFDRFARLTPPNESVRVAVALAAREVTGARIEKKDVSIVRGVAHISTASVVKNTIALHRAQILERVYEEVPKARNTVRDIR